MTEATLDYGVYSRGHSSGDHLRGAPKPVGDDAKPGAFVSTAGASRPPGTCIPWSRARDRLPRIQGDEKLCQDVWQSIDALAYMYVWWIALAF